MDITDVTDSRRTERMKRGRQEMLDETEVKGEFRGEERTQTN